MKQQLLLKLHLLKAFLIVFLMTGTGVQAQTLLFDNGTFVSATGTGFGGADVSVLQNVTLGYGTIGFSVNNTTPIRLTDQFTNTEPWYIEYVDVYGYQTGSTTTSTFTGGFATIWNGDPSTGTAVSEFGDFTTNRMILTDFTNCYRVQENASLTTNNRPIMRIRISINALIPAGTHWIEWGLTGSLASGPFSPNVSIWNVGNTGDSKQFNTSAYTGTLSNGAFSVGMPFKLYGTQFVAYTPTPNPLCQGETVTVNFFDPTVRNAGNTYTLELSDASGNFPGTLLPTTVVNATQLSAVIASGTAAGNYRIRVAASDPAENSAGSNTLEIKPIPGIAIESQTNVTCYGGTDGATSVLPTVGTAPYSFDWSPGTPTGDGTDSISGIAAGTWSCSVTDVYGCSATQLVTITAPPAMVLPALADITAECSATPIVPSTTDNCAGIATGTTTTVFPITTQGTTVVTWSFDDGNGQIVTANQNIIIDDITPPVVPTLADVTAECSATPTAPTTTDNCAGTITGTTTTIFPITTQGTTIVTWSFDDGNGQVVTVNQNIIIDDITPPVVPTLADVTAECSATPTAPTTTDNCSGTITGTTTTVFPITAQGTTVVTWSFDDGNGQVVTANQNIIIDDITPPVVPILADVTAECSATPTAPTTTDNCAGTITGTTTTVFPITAQGTTVVTWSFDDGNGQVVTANQNIIIDDVTPPVIPTLADVTAECSATPTVPTTTDNCTGTITGTTTTIFPITAQGTTVVIWTFDDGNGQVVTANQNVIIDDITPPVIPTLADVTAECSATPTVPTTTDNCAGTITGTTTTVFPITAQGTTVVTWTFDDGNGQVVTANQNVIIDDVTPPVIPTLADVTAECSATPTVPTTTDNCAGTITGTTTTVFPITAQGTTVVTWSFDDGNGQVVTANQNIIIDDVTPPVIPTLADVTAECSATPTVPTTTDNCAGTITGTTTTVFPITAQGTTVVTWSFDDGNGQIVTANQNIIIDDVTPPVIPTLADVTAECSATPTVPTTTDNCAGTITGTTTTVFPITAQGTTVVTWSFDDGNGQIVTANQNIIIDDVTPPVIPTLADITAECSATPIAPTTTDNCAGTITGTTTTVFPITAQGTTVVTWSFDDGNGQIVTANQNIIIDDITPPVIPTLADVTAECSATPTVPTTTDNCAGTITGTTTTVFPITAQGTTVVTWSFDDGNGQIVTANQNIIIDDITPPVIPTLADVTAECSATPTVPTTTDNCAGTITGTTTTVFPITAQGTTAVTWTFDDGNGQVVTANQNVIIDDITPPVIPTLADVTAECSATPSAPTTTDNCAGTITGTTTTVFPITAQGTTVVTWSFDDGNGQIVTANQNIIIDDITPPVIPTLADVTAECSATPSAPTTTDNCAGTITGTTTTVFPITAQGTTVVTWSFDDGNGQVVTANQNVIIDDITPPVIIAPSAVTVPENGGCAATNVVLGSATATDNCSSVTITNDAPATYTVGLTTVTWTATDLSGNSSTAIQNVIVTDQINPTASLQDITVVLDDAGTAEIQFSDIDLGSSDNCSALSSTLSQTTFDCGDIGLHTITVTLSDAQGNSTVATVTVTVESNGIDSDYDGIDDSCDETADPTYVKIPEAFTPNGNHINDYFVVGNITSFEERGLEVFNRYGNRVYENKNYNNEWDGTRSDNGKMLADGTYYYVLTLNGEVKKGYVYINRVQQ